MLQNARVTAFIVFDLLRENYPAPRLGLKHLSNLWKTPDIPLINCEINLVLTWSEKCVITSKAARDADPHADPSVAAANSQISATFKIADTKHCNAYMQFDWI